MTSYKYKYRSESHRLKDWNYANPSVYFITICTQERLYLFGEIKEGILILNENGGIVENEINKSIDIRKNMVFHNYVIMPNHVHFLIEILNVDTQDVDTQGVDTQGVDTQDVDTHSSAYIIIIIIKPTLIIIRSIRTAVRIYDGCQNQYHHLWQFSNLLQQNR
jgi:putative transposase